AAEREARHCGRGGGERGFDRRPRTLDGTRPRSLRGRGLVGRSGILRAQAPATLRGYGRSWAVPKSETAPGPGRSPAASTVALKVGWMQKMLTSVEECPIPSVRSPAAGEPVSVIVWAPPPAGPKAPALRCSQSGYSAGQPALLVHATGADGLGVGQAGFGSPAKQPVPRLLMSRQKPQKTLF